MPDHPERARAWLRKWYAEVGITISDLALTERTASLVAEFAEIERPLREQLLKLGYAEDASRQLEIAKERIAELEQQNSITRADQIKSLEDIHAQRDHWQAEWERAEAEAGTLRLAATETVKLIEALAGMEVGSMHPNDFATRDLKRALSISAGVKAARVLAAVKEWHESRTDDIPRADWAEIDPPVGELRAAWDEYAAPAPEQP